VKSVCWTCKDGLLVKQAVLEHSAALLLVFPQLLLMHAVTHCFAERAQPLQCIMYSNKTCDRLCPAFGTAKACICVDAAHGQIWMPLKASRCQSRKLVSSRCTPSAPDWRCMWTRLSGTNWLGKAAAMCCLVMFDFMFDLLPVCPSP